MRAGLEDGGKTREQMCHRIETDEGEGEGEEDIRS